MKTIFVTPDTLKDSPELNMIRKALAAELIELSRPLELVVDDEIMDHLLIVISNLCSEIPQPKEIYDRLLGKGYKHPAGWAPNETHPTPEQVQ